MAARKLQQEVDKCFKKVVEGVAEFDAIYEKIEQSNNPAQKEKLEDNLKREIKKLQRLRDQIKTWAAGNEIKDKGPLMENRRLIETQMERFKAVEKAMKTKAYSKEGLSAATKLDPKEQAKYDTSEFLSTQVDELEQQIEALEAERESIQATVKRGKMPSAKAERIARIDEIIDRHKFHQSKLELIRRSLENGGVEVEQVNDLEEDIRYYVAEGMTDDFMEDDTIYENLNLDEDEDAFGMAVDNDKVSSQDNQSIHDDAAETEGKAMSTAAAASAGGGGGASSSSGSGGGSGKGRQAASDAGSHGGSGRRPSSQVKSPLPTLATLHSPLPTLSNGPVPANMKPASIPARPAGEVLKYASAAAAAAAASEKVPGIAPLPPPMTGPNAPHPPAGGPAKSLSAVNSPKPASAQPVGAALSDKSASPAVSVAAPAKSDGPRSGRGKNAAAAAAAAAAATAAATASSSSSTTAAATGASEPSSGASGKGATPATASNGAPKATAAAAAAGAATATATEEEEDETEAEARDEESIYHLPASLHDLVASIEATKARTAATNAATNATSTAARLRMLAQSVSNVPEAQDGEASRRYFPEVRFSSTSNFPQEPLALLDDPRLYSRIEPDTLFYVFYYKQGTYQQYLAAKALKEMSWRFHKQYQTWFQRHEEPKSITEEYEMGTYRFFDYESTWMNRRKAEFKFNYRFLEDEV